MDFMSGFPTFELSLEIARPVAFFIGTAFEAILDPKANADVDAEPESKEPTIPWSYTLRNDEGQEVKIPNLGKPKAKFHSIIEKEYKPSFLKLDNLDFGQPDKALGPNGAPTYSVGEDGQTFYGEPTGFSVLSPKPVLHTYRR
jgi:hypothetical protein